jgi:hypothetical protein
MTNEQIIADLRYRLEDAQRQVAFADNEADQLRSQLDEKDMQLDTLGAQAAQVVSQVQAERDRLQYALGEAEDENLRLRNEVEELRRQGLA